jgi:diguanylate cyclase (GGDEF)-like protein
MRQPNPQSLDAIERHERQLWAVALVLLLALSGLIVVAFVALLDPESAAGSLAASELETALGGLLVLVVLFCLYSLQAHRSFQGVRRLYQQQALRDPLTGLLNRQSFADRFAVEVARARRDGRGFPILLCDLDHFKQINDTEGHQAGDRILRLAADALQAATRGSDFVFRWGGDEFLVMLSVASRGGALVAAQRIRRAVRRVAEVEGVSLDLSVGLAFFPEHAESGSRLLSLADRALYIAKKGGHKVHVGEEEYELDESAVSIVFQPVVEIDGRLVVGYEALSRDPEGRVGIQDVFRRYAAVGQLGELKRLIFRYQVRRAAELRLSRVFINVDFESLRTLEPLAKPEGVEVVLEISEAESLVDVESNLRTAETWRGLGYKFAIDDFGSGFMSLPFIARLIPDYIKIDGTMVAEAAGSNQFGGFLRDLVMAMRNYSKDGIIAEGIETERDFEVVRQLGIDQVQGYLTGEPAPWDDER